MSKYNAKKVEYKGIVFDSKVECEYYQYLESNMNGTNYDRSASNNARAIP